MLQIVSTFTGCTLAEADEVRRALGTVDGQPEVEVWLRPRALARGYDVATVDRVWQVLKAFASFGFCKAHAAAFALPTYQSAWLKAHHPAAFLAGVLTHDPGMYPKRLILDDARQFGIAVLPLDVNRSDATYRVEQVTGADAARPACRRRPWRARAAAYGIRLALAEVKGISEAEVGAHRRRPALRLAVRLLAPRVGVPPGRRAAGAHRRASTPSTRCAPTDRSTGSTRDRLTRRDLLLQVGELDRWSRAVTAAVGRAVTVPRVPRRTVWYAGRADVLRATSPPVPRVTARVGRASVRVEGRLDDRARAAGVDPGCASSPPASRRRRDRSRRRRCSSPSTSATRPHSVLPSGLPEMTGAERVRAELEVLGLDASRHVVDFYEPFLAAIGATRAPDLVRCRSQAEVLVAGVKVATQTPPIRSGKRVVFVTLDDARGPIDATFFEDAQGPYAATLFHSWLLVIRGHVRRTGPRGVSMRATGCWELTELHSAWRHGGLDAVAELMAAHRPGHRAGGRRRRREPVDPPGDDPATDGWQRRGLRAARGRRRPVGRRHGAGRAGAGAPERVPPVALRRHQAARRRRGGDGAQGSGRKAGATASGGAAQAVAHQPGQLGPVS